MSWQLASKDALEAAKVLRSHPRSCISRAYYAAFSAANQALVDTKGVRFPEGRDGPSHEKLPILIGNHLAGRFDFATLKLIKTALRRLYNARIYADYKPGIPLTQSEATQSLLDAKTVLLKLDML